MKTPALFVGCFAVSVALAVSASAQTLPAASAPDGGLDVSLTYGRNRDPLSFAQPFAAGLRLSGLRDVRIKGETERQRNAAINVSGRFWGPLSMFTELLHNDLGESHFSARVGFLPPANITLRAQLFEWTSGARVHLPTGTSRVRPYIGGGAGTVWLRMAAESTDVNISETAREFTYHLDAGLQMFVTSRVGIAPELRFVNVPDETFYRLLVSAVFRFQ